MCRSGNMTTGQIKKESPMENITLLAIDIAKNVFELHGVNEKGKAVYRKQIKRKELLSRIANIPPCLIAMESCGGANHWGRQFEKLGAKVVEVNLPMTPHAVAVYYIIACAEASANLARFDGVRYGFRSKESSDPYEMYCLTRAAGFGAEEGEMARLGRR